jgi:hypothetical protein
LISAVLDLPRLYGLQGILYAAPLADGLAAVLTLVVFLKALRELENIPVPGVVGVQPEVLGE